MGLFLDEVAHGGKPRGESRQKVQLAMIANELERRSPDTQGIRAAIAF